MLAVAVFPPASVAVAVRVLGPDWRGTALATHCVPLTVAKRPLTVTPTSWPAVTRVPWTITLSPAIVLPLAGLVIVICRGGLTMKLRGAVVPPPGAGLVTVTG
jgi:hypothetical protein